MKIFIIPYRNRENQKNLFLQKIVEIIKVKKWNIENIKILFIHQCDKRLFNRGAMKNIGFLTVKNMFPNKYKNITLIFHDVDTYPSTPDLLPYETKENIVSHYYGYKFALGGIFAIKGIDFEKTLGFPNFWGWGFEDNCFYERCLSSNLEIDRTIFFDIKDKRIERPFDGFNRVISKREINIYKKEDPDTIHDIKNLNYNIDTVKFGDSNLVYNIINVNTFNVKRVIEKNEFMNYDIRKGNKIIIPSGYFRRNWSMF